MTNLYRTTHTTPASGNIFLDLGFAPIEAAMLYAESKAIIERRRHVGSLFATFPQLPGCLDAPDMIPKERERLPSSMGRTASQ